MRDDIQAMLGPRFHAVEPKPSEPSTDGAQAHVVRKVIAALRQAGIACSLVINESDHPGRK
jgi:hypothetical protein